MTRKNWNKWSKKYSRKPAGCCAPALACGLAALWLHAGTAFASDPAARLRAAMERFYDKEASAEAKAAALAELGELCDARHGPACTRLGHISADGPDRDPKKREQFYRRGCKLDDPGGCTGLAGLLRRDRNKAAEVEQLYQKAERLYREACDANDGRACYELARIYSGRRSDPGYKGPREGLYEKADALTAKACELGHPWSCFGLGQTLRRTDPAGTVQFYARACELGEQQGCSDLDNALHAWLTHAAPERGTRDFTTALSQMQRLIESEPADADLQLALAAALLGEGKADRAREALDRAAELERAKPDKTLSVLIPLGRLIAALDQPRDRIAERFAAFEKACLATSRNGRRPWIVVAGMGTKLRPVIDRVRAITGIPKPPPELPAPLRSGKRQLPADATFRDLVGVLMARGLAITPQGKTRRCLVRGFKRKGRAGSVAATGVVPSKGAPKLIPDAWLDEVDRMSLDLISPHGTLLRQRSDTWLYTLTPVSRLLVEAPAVPVLLVERDRTRMGAILTAGSVTDGRWLPMGEKEWAQFDKRILKRAPGVVVTARAEVPLWRLRQVLARLQGKTREVVLAVFVEADRDLEGAALQRLTHLPAQVDRRDPPAGFCGYDTGSIPRGRTPGYYGNQAFKLNDRFSATVAKACRKNQPAGRAGSLEVSMRIGKSGEVERACISRDPIDHAPLRDCVLRQARAYRFPALPRGDLVNLGVGVPFEAQPMAPLCDP